MSVHRVLCFGGRDFDNRNLVYRALDHLPGVFSGEKWCIVQGCASGADRISGEWGAAHGIPVIQIPAQWAYYGAKSAGSIRNGWMIEFCQPTYAVEFPGGRGTRDMRLRLIEFGIQPWMPYA